MKRKKFCIGAGQLRRSSLSSLSLLWSYGRLSLPSFFMFLVIVLIFWFFEWITGADLDRHNVDEMNEKRKEEGLPPAPYQDEEMDDYDDVSDTLWDIYTADQLSHHHHDDYDDNDDRY
ncbi:hypothetical protein ACOBMG_09295 [Limosilactobacillus mucosae]